IQYFFTKRTDVLSQMTPREIGILRALYDSPEYLEVLPTTEVEHVTNRKCVRFDVSCEGRIVLSATRVIKLMIKNVSAEGFLCYANESIRYGEEVNIQVAVASFEIADLKGWPAWNDSGMYGFHLSGVCEKWRNF